MTVLHLLFMYFISIDNASCKILTSVYHHSLDKLSFTPPKPSRLIGTMEYCSLNKLFYNIEGGDGIINMVYFSLVINIKVKFDSMRNLDATFF
jgi:hypothetical protein